MKQVFYGRNYAWGTGAAATYTGPFALRRIDTDVTRGSIAAPANGTIRNLKIKLGTAPGSGKTWTFDVYINGAGTAVTLTIADTATSNQDITHSVSVSTGDVVSIRRVLTVGSSPTAPGSTYYSLEWEGSTAGESVYGTHDVVGAVFSSTAIFYGLFNSDDSPLNDAGSGNNFRYANVSPIAGTLTGLRVKRAQGALASGDIVFTVYKNDVIQDGGSGSVDTRATIGTGSGQASSTFSLTVAEGDVLYIGATSASGQNGRCACSCTFVATTSGDFAICGNDLTAPSTSAVNYNAPNAGDISDGPNATETVRDYIGGTTSIWFKKMRARIVTAPGAAKSYTYVLRRDASAPGNTPTVTISGAVATTGSDANGKVLIGDANTFCFESTPAGTPASAAVDWGWAGNTSPGGGGAGKGTGKPNKGGGGVQAQFPGGAQYLNYGVSTDVSVGG